MLSTFLMFGKSSECVYFVGNVKKWAERMVLKVGLHYCLKLRQPWILWYALCSLVKWWKPSDLFSLLWTLICIFSIYYHNFASSKGNLVALFPDTADFMFYRVFSFSQFPNYHLISFTPAAQKIVLCHLTFIKEKKREWKAHFVNRLVQPQRKSLGVEP